MLIIYPKICKHFLRSWGPKWGGKVAFFAVVLIITMLSIYSNVCIFCYIYSEKFQYLKRKVNHG